VQLQLKVFETLCVLVENAGRLLKKEDLLQEVWPDTVVEENNLNKNVSLLRKALGENTNGASSVSREVAMRAQSSRISRRCQELAIDSLRR